MLNGLHSRKRGRNCSFVIEFDNQCVESTLLTFNNTVCTMAYTCQFISEVAMHRKYPLWFLRPIYTLQLGDHDCELTLFKQVEKDRNVFYIVCTVHVPLSTSFCRNAESEAPTINPSCITLYSFSKPKWN